MFIAHLKHKYSMFRLKTIRFKIWNLLCIHLVYSEGGVVGVFGKIEKFCESGMGGMGRVWVRDMDRYVKRRERERFR
jgi:nitrogen regulatory protein PII